MTNFIDRVSKLAKESAERAQARESLKEVNSLLSSMGEAEALAVEQIAVKYPELPRQTTALITRAIADILKRHKHNGTPLTPFARVNEVTISDPESVVSLLKSRGKRIPTTPFMRSNEVDRAPTANMLALMSGINRGSFNSVVRGRQHFSAKDLELWRDALSQIGVYNDIYELSALSNPETFLTAIVDEIMNLESTMPLSRVEEWADVVHATDPDLLSREFIDSELARARSVTLPHIFDSMVNVWRGQLVNGEVETFDGRTLIDVLSTRTSSRRFSRGLQNLIASVHTGMSPFNSRIKYPACSYATYKQRYAVQGETGLTSDILMAYCFYLGINPVAMVNWLAEAEKVNPGSAEPVKGGYAPRDVVKWVGNIDPVEYDKFIAATLSLGIVPDEMRFSLAMLVSKFVFLNLPNHTEMAKRLGSHYDAYRQPIEEYLSQLDSYTAECALPNKLMGSHYTIAVKHGVKPFDLYSDVLASGYYIYGASRLPGNMGEVISEDMNDLIEEAEIIEYAKDKIMRMMGGSEGSYSHLVKDNDGEIDHSASCQARPFAPREVSDAAKLYRGLFESLDLNNNEDEDDLLSLMNQ